MSCNFELPVVIFAKSTVLGGATSYLANMCRFLPEALYHFEIPDSAGFRYPQLDPG